jgi:choline dehydrogenase
LQEGVGLMPLSAREVARQSSADLYLHPLPRPNLDVRLGTSVTRVMLDAEGIAHGVEVDGGTIPAHREVIVCCGAINTPRLLMRSGIGPAQTLESRGIDVIVEHPELGANLSDHPVAVVTWDLVDRPGQSTVHGWEAGLLARAGSPEPELFLMFATYAYDRVEAPDQGFSIAVYLMRPRSRGSVLLSSDPEQPMIRIGHFTDEHGADLRNIRAGVELARTIAAQPSLRGWLGAERAPGSDVHGDGLDDYVRRTADTMFHPAGTCRIGLDAHAVVTPRLKVRGTGGLRVADASVFPAPVSVTPYLTCLMIGERCADFVLAELC